MRDTFEETFLKLEFAFNSLKKHGKDGLILD